MIRGTTAQFKFKLPYKKSELLWANIQFWQPGNPGIGNPLPITKTLQHCTGPEDVEELCVALLPEETMRFSDKFKAKVQLRAYNKDTASVFASRQQSITVYPLNDAIINPEDSIPPIPDNNEGWVIFDGESIATQSVVIKNG